MFLELREKRHMLTALVKVAQPADDTAYGIASAIFIQNIKRALKVAHPLEIGTVFVRVGTSYLLIRCFSRLKPWVCGVCKSTFTTRQNPG